MTDPEKPGPAEDVKAKMREALEKKAAHGGKDVSSKDPRVSAAHGRSGNVSNQKSFRRKSG